MCKPPYGAMEKTIAPAGRMPVSVANCSFGEDREHLHHGLSVPGSRHTASVRLVARSVVSPDRNQNSNARTHRRLPVNAENGSHLAAKSHQNPRILLIPRIWSASIGTLRRNRPNVSVHFFEKIAPAPDRPPATLQNRAILTAYTQTFSATPQNPQFRTREPKAATQRQSPPHPKSQVPQSLSPYSLVPVP
jgi:hypothetical protein